MLEIAGASRLSSRGNDDDLLGYRWHDPQAFRLAAPAGRLLGHARTVCSGPALLSRTKRTELPRGTSFTDLAHRHRGASRPESEALDSGELSSIREFAAGRRAEGSGAVRAPARHDRLVELGLDDVRRKPSGLASGLHADPRRTREFVGSRQAVAH